MKKYILLGIICLLFSSGIPVVYGEEVEEDTLETDINTLLEAYDFSELQERLNEIYGGKSGISFESIIQSMISGDIEGAAMEIIEGVKEQCSYELLENKTLLKELILIAILAAVFSNLSNSFSGSFLGENGFYIAYLFMLSILMSSFYLLCAIAEETLTNIAEFMKVFVPAYMMSVTVTTGVSTSVSLYEGLFIGIELIEWGILKIIFPMIRIYVVLSLVNNISAKDYFSKLCQLIKSVVQWGLKTITVALVGMNVMKSLLVPAIDSLKSQVVQKSISAVPGGQAVSALTSILIGSGVLIKNSIGLAGVLLLIGIVSVPVMQIVIFVLSYKGVTAILQPVSDKRLLAGMTGMIEGSSLLLRAVTTACVMFILSIALIAAATGSRA